MPPSQSETAAKKAASKKAEAAKPAQVETPTPAPAEVTETVESGLSDAAKALAAEALAAAEAAQQSADSDASGAVDPTDPLGAALPDGCEGPEHDPAINAECENAPQNAPEDTVTPEVVDPVKETLAPAAATLTAPEPAPEPEPEPKLTASLTEAAIERVGLSEGYTVLRDFKGNRLDPAAVFSEVEEGGLVRVISHVVVHTTETEYRRMVRTQLLAPNAFVSVAEARAVREQIVASNAIEDALLEAIEELASE